MIDPEDMPLVGEISSFDDKECLRWMNVELDFLELDLRILKHEVDEIRRDIQEYKRGVERDELG